MTNKNKLIRVDEATFSLWRNKLRFGDVKKIAEHTKITAPVISRAINHQLASQECINGINEYFKAI